MIAILADVHANHAALDAVVEDSVRMGAREYVFLGDAVGYHCQPNECISLLADIGAVALLGNHDQYLLQGGECPRSRSVTATLQHNLAVLTDASRNWLQSLSARRRCDRTLFVHGSPRDDLEEYLYKVDPEVLPHDTETLFCGHTHVQAIARTASGLTFCNPGSVGQPRDGDPRAAYVLVDGSRIIPRRVNYDVERTVATMMAAGFPSHHYVNLRAGTQIGGRIDTITFSGGFE